VPFPKLRLDLLPAMLPGPFPWLLPDLPGLLPGSGLAGRSRRGHPALFLTGDGGLRSSHDGAVRPCRPARYAGVTRTGRITVLFSSGSGQESGMAEAGRALAGRYRRKTRGDHHHSPVESRPVFADPSGRRRKVLRFAGIGSMAVLAAFLVATVMAVTGGPRAPLTQWAVPQAPSSGAKHSGDQALTGGKSRSGAPRASSGTVGPASGGTTVPGQSASTPPSGAPSARPTPSPATASRAASPTATARGHGHANPHSSQSAGPTA
jgi:hypothetical protein